MALMTIHRVFFFLLLALLPTQLGLHTWPSWSFVLGRRIDYLSPTLYGTDVLIAGLLISWALERRALLRISAVRSVFAAPRRTLFFAVATAAVAALNIALALSPPAAFYAWVKTAEFFALGFYVVRTRVPVSFIVAPLALGALYSSLLAGAQYMHQGSLGGVFRLLGERSFTMDTPGIARFSGCIPFANQCFFTLRPYATFPHPNVLAGFLGSVVLLIAHAFFYADNPVRRHTWWYVGVGGCSLLALLLSFSRSAWIGLAIGFAAIELLRPRHRAAERRAMYSALCWVVCLLFLVAGYVFRPSLMDQTLAQRRVLNSAAVALWQAAPSVGVGLGNFVAAVPSVVRYRDSAFLQPVHNIYLLAASQIGIAGILLVAAGLARVVSTVVFLVGNRQTADSRRLYVPPLLFMLFIGSVDHYPLTLQQGQLLLTLLLAGILAPVKRAA